MYGNENCMKSDLGEQLKEKWSIESRGRDKFDGTSGKAYDFFFFFLWQYLQHMEVPGLGVKLALLWQQPQQHGIQAASATYIAACCNAGSLTHRARSGIEPVSKWILAGFLTHWAITGTLQWHVIGGWELLPQTPQGNPNLCYRDPWWTRVNTLCIVFII